MWQFLSKFRLKILFTYEKLISFALFETISVRSWRSKHLSQNVAKTTAGDASLIRQQCTWCHNIILPHVICYNFVFAFWGLPGTSNFIPSLLTFRFIPSIENNDSVSRTNCLWKYSDFCYVFLYLFFSFSFSPFPLFGSILPYFFSVPFLLFLKISLRCHFSCKNVGKEGKKKHLHCQGKIRCYVVLIYK